LAESSFDFATFCSVTNTRVFVEIATADALVEFIGAIKNVASKARKAALTTKMRIIFDCLGISIGPFRSAGR
jgi:hypothetical protein